MTTCTITGFACNCQPDEGVPCNGLAELRKAYAEWRTKAEQLRGTLSLAEEGLANYAQENERLKSALERIKKLRYGLELHSDPEERAEYWSAMALEYRRIAAEALRPAEPQPAEHK